MDKLPDNSQSLNFTFLQNKCILFKNHQFSNRKPRQSDDDSVSCLNKQSYFPLYKIFTLHGHEKQKKLRKPKYKMSQETNSQHMHKDQKHTHSCTHEPHRSCRAGRTSRVVLSASFQLSERWLFALYSGQRCQKESVSSTHRPRPSSSTQRAPASATDARWGCPERERERERGGIHHQDRWVERRMRGRKKMQTMVQKALVYNHPLVCYGKATFSEKVTHLKIEYDAQ